MKNLKFEKIQRIHQRKFLQIQKAYQIYFQCHSLLDGVKIIHYCSTLSNMKWNIMNKNILSIIIFRLNSGYSFKTQKYYSILYWIGSILAAYICTLQLSKQQQKGLQPEFDKYIKITLGIGFSFLSLEIVLYNYLPSILLEIISLFIGAGTGGLYSLFLESLMEKHYPVHELTIGTVLFIVASVEGVLMNFILRIPKFADYGFLISCFFTIGPFCYIMMFYETQYKRFEQEG